MFDQLILPGFGSAISSPASEDGPARSGSPAGPTTGPSGLAPAPVSHSATPAPGKAKTTIGTYGPLFEASSPSAALQASLESRLRAALEGTGSPLYALTWKRWDMRSGPPICALRASAPRTSGNGSGSERQGWPTPNSEDAKAGQSQVPGRKQVSLPRAAIWAGWPTPTVNDSRGGRNHTSGRSNPDSKHHDGITLCDAGLMAGWPTPAAHEFEIRDPEKMRARRAALAEKQGNNGFGLTLGMMAVAELPGPARLTARGEMLTGSSAGMAAGGQLNPAHSRWLMGYPDAWGFCGAMAMRSFQRSRRRS